MQESPVQVLFVSRRGSLRSVLAQACLDHVGKGRFKGHACGLPGQVASGPSQTALSVMRSAHLPISGVAPRSMDHFLRSGAARMEFVITLDDKAAALAPRWPHQPETALWHYPDLLAGIAPAQRIEERTVLMLHSLRRRLEIFASLPMRGTDKAALRLDLRDIGYLR